MNLKDYAQKALAQVKEAAPAGGVSDYVIDVEFDVAVDESKEGDLYISQSDGGARVKFKAKVLVQGSRT
jgi:hypothetical protein